MDSIGFRPVTAEDLPLLREWILQDHWQKWWGDADAEIGYIRDMIEGRDTTKPFIFQADGRDAGYIQYWTVADQLFEPWLTEAPWMKALPRETIGVDISIGGAEMLSRGLGSRAVHTFSRKLWQEGYREIIIDPDPANKRAVRAYEKAGFAPVPELLGRTGDYLIMKFDPEKASIKA